MFTFLKNAICLLVSSHPAFKSESMKQVVNDTFTGVNDSRDDHLCTVVLDLNVLWEVLWGAVKPWEKTFAEKFPDNFGHHLLPNFSSSLRNQTSKESFEMG